ncbi:MAG: AsmA family protein [Alphaproteobacteria bacterium]
MKRTLKILGGIVVLVIVLLLVAPLFISAEVLKRELIAQASQATGRQVQVNGKASLKLFPDIAISAQDVTVGNPAGFASPYLLHAKTLSTGAALGPLLHGALNVTGITLDGADVRLEQLPNGAKNWEFTKEKVQQKASESAQKNAASGAPSALKSFALGDISIKDSSVTMVKPGQRTALTDIDLTVKGADASSPLKVDGSASYNGKSVKISAQIDRLRDFLAASYSPAKVTIDIPGGSVKFDGKAALGDAIAAQGDLALNVSDLPGTLGWASGKPASGKMPKSVSLAGTVSASGNKYTIKGATLKADSVTATGNLAADLSGAAPSVSGSLGFGALDLDALMKTAQATPSRNPLDAEAAEASSGWSTAPLDLSALRSVNADLNITAQSVKVDKLSLGATALHAVLNGGALTVAIQKAALYGGNASGTVSASSANAIGADLAVSDVQVEPLLVALHGFSHLSGKANFRLNVKGAGASQRAIVASLGGNGSFAIADGKIKGINLAQFWREAKQGFLTGSAQQATDFSALTGTFTIANGVLSNSDLSMLSPALRASGKGTVNLLSETIDYRLTPSVVETSKGQGGAAKTGFEIPLDIRGPLANPSIVPDAGALIQQAPALLKKVNGNTVKGMLGSGSKGVSGLLKGLGAH